MRLVSFAVTGPSGRVPRLGALVSGDADDGVLIDVNAAATTLLVGEGLEPAAADHVAGVLAPTRLLDLVRGGPRARDLTEQAVEAATTAGWESSPTQARIRYACADFAHGTATSHLPAILDPPMLRDFMAFEQHLINIFPRLGREIPSQWYELPVYYKGNPSALGAHGQPIEVPSYADELDLEFELAVIIGRGGIDIAEEVAAEHVFGYTVYDDFSARAIQAQEMAVGLGPAKGKDFTGAHVLGPMVVTADEVPDPYALGMRATVNGEEWTRGSTAQMHWRFEQMIAHASRAERLQVGEVFGSGTVGGGSGAEQDRILAPGDVVELTVDVLGTLRNQIVAAAPPEPHGPDRHHAPSGTES